MQPLDAFAIPSDPINEPKRGRGRRDLTEQRRLITERRQVGQESPPSPSITARSRTTQP